MGQFRPPRQGDIVATLRTSISSVARLSRPDPRFSGRGLLLHSFVRSSSHPGSAIRGLGSASPRPRLPCPRRSAPRLRSKPRRRGKTWFMAPDARCGGGKGTLEDPWCIQDALESRRVKPGDTIEARLGGTYKLRETAGGFAPITRDARGLARPAHYGPALSSGPDHADDAHPDRLRPAGARRRPPIAVRSSRTGSTTTTSRSPTSAIRGATGPPASSTRPGFGTGVRVFADAKKSRRRREPPHQLGRARHRGRRLQVGPGQSDRLLRHGRLQLRVSLQPREGPAHRGPRLLPPQRDRGERPPQKHAIPASDDSEPASRSR